MYTPLQPPVASQTTDYVFQEFLRISEELNLIREGRGLSPLAVAPAKPREGMLVVADGTNWNPGSGKGAYEYLNGAWHKL